MKFVSRLAASAAAMMAVALLMVGVHAQTSPLVPDTTRVYSLRLDNGTKTVAATAGAATLNKSSGKITTEALSTAAAASYTLTLTNSTVAAVDQVYASVAYGTASAGTPAITRVTPGAGSVTIVVRNIDASAAFNGTLVVSYAVLKN